MMSLSFQLVGILGLVLCSLAKVHGRAEWWRLTSALAQARATDHVPRPDDDSLLTLSGRAEVRAFTDDTVELALHVQPGDELECHQDGFVVPWRISFQHFGSGVRGELPVALETLDNITVIAFPNTYCRAVAYGVGVTSRGGRRRPHLAMADDPMSTAPGPPSSATQAIVMAAHAFTCI